MKPVASRRCRSATGALLAVSLTLCAPAAGQDDLDLSGLWTTGDGERIRIRQQGTSVRGNFVSGAACPFGGSRSYYIEGQLQGSALKGTMQRCTGEDAQRLITECGETDPWKTPFESVALRKSISGTYHAEGWAYDEEGGRWVNCRRDERFASEDPFRLTRRCYPKEIWDRLREFCAEAEARHEANEAEIRVQEERFEAGYDAAVHRFFSLKVLGLGLAKGAGKYVLLKQLGKVAQAFALKVIVVGGVAYLVIEAGHASKDIEDANYALESILEMLEQSIELSSACIAALEDLEACKDDIEEEREAEEERRREQERQENLRRRAEELLEYSGRYGDTYEDAQGNVYRGQDALRAAMRDLEAQVETTQGPAQSINAPIGADEEPLRAVIRAGLRQAYGREPSEAEISATEQEIHAVDETELRRLAAQESSVGRLLEATTEMGDAAGALSRLGQPPGGPP